MILPDQFLAAGDLDSLDGETIKVYACPRCGGLTATPNAHIAWHRDLEAELR